MFNKKIVSSIKSILMVIVIISFQITTIYANPTTGADVQTIDLDNLPEILEIILDEEEETVVDDDEELGIVEELVPKITEQRWSGSIKVRQNEMGDIETIDVDLGELGQALGLNKQSLNSRPIIMNYDKDSLIIIVIFGVSAFCLYKLSSALVSVTIDAITKLLTKDNNNLPKDEEGDEDYD